MSQVVGLAEAVGIPFIQKTVDLRVPWRWLPGHLCPRVFQGLSADSDQLVPPWPEVLIACGRRSVAAALAIRRASKGHTFTIYIQDPRIPLHYFDLVVAPRHDGLQGANVITTHTALHRVTPARLAEHAVRHSARFSHLPRPLVAVLLGGSSHSSKLTPAYSAEIGRQLLDMTMKTGAGLAITPSRRTGRENLAAFINALQDSPYYLWDGSGDNPYFGILGLADYIIITGDSVSMVSEACATGKPVYIVDLPGYSRRLQIFHEELRREGVTRPFTGLLEHWTYEPINNGPRIAEEIHKRLGVSRQVMPHTRTSR